MLIWHTVSVEPGNSAVLTQQYYSYTDFINRFKSGLIKIANF